MVKRFLWIMGVLLLSFTLMMNVPLIAQEEQKEEDIEDFSLEDLLNVEITTAGKQSQKISEIPASIVLITREDIERYGYRSLIEVMENVPGLYALDDMGFHGTSFGMRGFFAINQKNFAVMVNGVRQQEGFFRVTDPTNFPIPVEAIDRVEVVKGPMSVIYGPGAFFGAINIITNQIENDKSMNIISVSAGSEATIQSSVRFSANTGDLNYAFNAGFSNTDGPNEPFSRMTTMDLSWAGIVPANSSTENRLEDQNKYFNLSVDYKGFYAKMSHSQSIKDSYIVIPSVSDGTNITSSFSSVSFGYKKESEKFDYDLNLTFLGHEWVVSYDFFDPIFYGDEFMQSHQLEADITTTYKPTSKLSLTTGVHYHKVTRAQAYDNVPVIELNVFYKMLTPIELPSMFMQVDYAFSNSLKLVAGFRLEKPKKYDIGATALASDGTASDTFGSYDNDSLRFIPRLALIYSINKSNVVKFLYGKANIDPVLQENLENIIYSQPSLNAEEITTFEINYITSPSSMFTASFSLFYNKLQNLIVRTFNFDAGYQSFYSNGGEIETFGGELTVLARPFKNFVLDLSGTYQKSEDKRPGFKDIDVEYSPDLLLHLKASYNFGKNATLALTGRYVGEMYPHYDDEAGVRIGEKTDSYFVMGANLRINNLFNKGYFINLRVKNLFDTEYLYPTMPSNNLIVDLGTIGRGIGRAFLVTFGKSW